MRKWVVGSSIVGIVSILGVILIAILDPATRDKIGIELVKLLLQVLVMAILGGIVSLLTEDFNHRRRKAEALNDYRKTLLNRLVQAYSGVKRARRLLRAKPSVSNYDEQMGTISETQLDLEAIVEEIKSSTYAFSHAEIAISSIQRMADYLNRLVDEYEKKRSKIPDDSPSVIPFGMMHLADFIGPYSESIYKVELVLPYRSALATLRDDVLKAEY